MASSEARIEANRRNAQKSTGPKTAEGKARSRANGLKHGLTGDGVVLPADDVAKVAELEARLAADFPAGGEAVATLVRRYAVLSVRLDRCADHDAAMTAQRVRNAVVDRDNQRYDEVADHARRLATEPADAVRRLKQTPEGIDWLLGRWRALRGEVAATMPDAGADLLERAGVLLGMTAAEARVSDWAGRCRALAGEPAKSADGPGEARAWVLGAVDAEVELLRWLRAEVDEEAEAADRAEAPARALFDLGPEAERMRRYEAAAERHLFRTLRELRQAQAEAGGKAEPKPAPPPPAPMPAPAPAPLSPGRILASFSAAEQRILGDLPGPVRDLALEFGDYIDIAAIPAAVEEIRNRRNAKPKRPRLR